MALADLPDGFVVFSRDEIEARYKRDYALRNPEADVVSGQPDVDAKQAADLVTPIYFDAKLIADGINEDAATDERLDLVGTRKGLKRGAASGATGYVLISAAAGGGSVVTGDEIENPQTRKKYEAAESKTVQNGDHVRVRAKSKGPETDVDAGVVLRWTSPRPGISQNATVVAQSGGRGLTGGAEAQNDERFRDAIRARNENPPAGDNDAEIQAVLMATPDVPIEQIFTCPGFASSGSTAYTFTVRAATLGASRVPTDAQLQASFEWMRAQLPGDNSYFPRSMLTSPLVVAFSVEWATGGWTDVIPWPTQYSDAVIVASATDPLNFVVSGGSTAPTVGQTIGVWDNAKKLFRRKRVSAVTGTGPWTLVCTAQNAASDTTYTPVPGQLVSPWSDNLSLVPTPVLTYLATLGPGQFLSDPSSDFAGGRRRHRQPEAPKLWPSKTTAKLTTGVGDLACVAGVTAKSGVDVDVAANITPRLSELTDLAIFSA